MMLQRVPASRRVKEISFSRRSPQPQTDRPQCEIAGVAQYAERACSSKLNSVSSAVRRCGPPEYGARTRSTARPVYTEIFIGRANRKWADRFVARAESTLSDCTWSMGGETWGGAGVYVIKRVRKREKAKLCFNFAAAPITVVERVTPSRNIISIRCMQLFVAVNIYFERISKNLRAPVLAKRN